MQEWCRKTAAQGREGGVERVERGGWSVTEPMLGIVLSHRWHRWHRWRSRNGLISRWSGVGVFGTSSGWRGDPGALGAGWMRGAWRRVRMRGGWFVWFRGQDARATGWGGRLRICGFMERGVRSRIRSRIRIRIKGLIEGGEVGGAEIADFVAEIEVDADEFVTVDPVEVAFGDGGFDVGLDFGEAGEVGFAGGEGLLVEGFKVDGAEGADVRGEFVVPVDEGALGDVDVGGDAREAEAFGAHFEELIFSFVRMHGTSFRMVGAKDQTLHWLYWLYWLFLHRQGV